jgi:type IV pilus assembly protein PilA|tara:strand:+ start:751 stop:1239 length:489 start_codon:yes stop_codon:yes gene_type:complete
MTSSIRTKLTLRLIEGLKRPKAITTKAFTLVELLVVVAIVGILSSVALPNFLSQTDKAKATEAKTNIASTLKQAHAKFLEDGTAPSSAIADMNSNYGTPTNDTTLFNYEQVNWSDPVWTIKAVGNDTDSGLEDKELDGCVNFDTGVVDIQSQLDSSTAVSCS